jgi:peptidoglycan/LPS O-acetylase OafA/YrhL
MGFSIKKIQTSQEIVSIEFLRGVAAALVCYFHLSSGNIGFLPDTSIVKRSGSWGWAGVEIFFVISGFVIPYAMYRKNYTIRNIFVFLKKRIIRIEPPYLVSIIIVIFLGFISTLSPFYRGMPFSVDWINVVSHVAYLNVITEGAWLNPVYWSLAIEFQYYLLIALLFPLLVSDKRYVRLLFFVCFLALSFLPIAPGRFILNYTGYFLAGILLFQWVYKIATTPEMVLLLAISTGTIGYLYGVWMMLLIILTILIIVYVNEIPVVFRRLGLISYSLYLLHVPFGGRIINISENLIHNTTLRECIVFAAFAICILVSAVFYKYIEVVFKKLSASISYDRDIVMPETAVIVKD